MSESTISMCKYLGTASMHTYFHTTGIERTENTGGTSSSVSDRNPKDFRNTSSGGRFNLAYVDRPSVSIEDRLFFSVGVRLASLIIPLFMNFLPEPGLSSSKTTNSSARLISYIIERIQYLIPIYPNEFRLVLQTFPDLRTKLESAIRRQQQIKQHRDEKESSYSSRGYLSSASALNAGPQAPTLSLRIDFSNFKSS